MTDIRSNSLAKYPGLWRGCVFAAAPCLGPTGTVLRTFTPTHNQALLTNMDPATDWVVSGGRYALDFDGSNDHVNVASPVGITSTGPQCVSFWFRCSGAVVPGNYPCVFSLGIAGIPYTSQLNCGFNQFATGVSGGTGRLTTLSYDGVSLASGCYSNTNFVGTSSWYHVVTGWDGVAWKIFVNGVDETNAQNSQVAPAAITAPRMVWGGHASLNRPAVVQLDDMRMYHRFLAASEIRLLASRRGISYEQRRRGVFFPAGAGTEYECDPSDLQSQSECQAPSLGVHWICTPDSLQSQSQCSQASVSVGWAADPQDIEAQGQLSAPACTLAWTADPQDIQSPGQVSAPSVAVSWTAESEDVQAQWQCSQPNVTVGGSTVQSRSRRLFLSGGLFLGG